MKNEVRKFVPTLAIRRHNNILAYINKSIVNTVVTEVFSTNRYNTGLTYLLEDTDDTIHYRNEAILIGGNLSQPYALERLNKSGVQTPEWWVGNGVYGNPGIMQLDTKYVVKANGTARSLGKAVVDRATFIRMTSFAGKLAAKVKNITDAQIAEYGVEFNKKFNIYPGHYINDNEKYRLLKQLYYRRFVIQEYVDIKNEYRVYYTDVPNPDDRFITMKREGCGIGTEEDEDTYLVANKTIPKKMLTSINKYLKNNPTPILCFDIYQDVNNKWGVFEVTDNWGDDGDGIIEMMEDKVSYAYLNCMKKVNPMIEIMEEACLNMK